MSLAYASTILSRKFGSYQSPVASGYTWVSSQGYAWYQSVLAAGASITNANQAVFDTAFQAIYGNTNIANAIKQTGFLFGFSDGSGGSGSAINGCFVPIVGSSVTNNNFVAGDYSRTAGLTGNGSNKYLNLNRANNADTQNSKHIFVSHATAGGSSGNALIGSGSASGDSYILDSTSSNCSANSTLAFTKTIGGTNNSIGLNRGNSATQVRAYSGTGTGSTSLATSASTGVTSNTINLFQRGGTNYYSGTLFFYSIGSSFSSAASELVTLAGIVNTAYTSIT
jgi:hypothetical protein